MVKLKKPRKSFKLIISVLSGARKKFMIKIYKL